MAGVQSEFQRNIIATAATDTTIAAGVADKRIRVLSCVVVASGGANNVRFESTAGGTALTGVMNLAANGQLVLPYNEAGWFETLPGQLLNLELSAATAVGGAFTFVQA